MISRELPIQKVVLSKWKREIQNPAFISSVHHQLVIIVAASSCEDIQALIKVCHGAGGIFFGRVDIVVCPLDKSGKKWFVTIDKRGEAGEGGRETNPGSALLCVGRTMENS